LRSAAGLIAALATSPAALTVPAAASPVGPAAPAPRGSPSVDVVLPRGGQRGSETTIAFHGQRLADAAGILFHEPGIELLSIEAPDEGRAVARVRIAPDCPLGEHRLRLRTRTGVSELRTFWVGPFPIADETEPDNDLEHAQPIGRNVTVHGVVTGEDVDVFAVEMKAGDRLSVEVEGVRLGETLFDPFVAILDEKRFELASCDDSSLFRQDPAASCVVPADGRYFVLVREASFGGHDRCRYRLHVGTFPRPLVASPAGGKSGSEVAVALIGDVRGTMAASLRLPEGPPSEFTVWPEQDGVPAPSGLPLRIGPFEPVPEVEPNDAPAQATGAGRGPPLAFDGVLERPGDVDFVRFAARKDERTHLRVHARSIRSPLDPVLSIHRSDGAQLDAADDVVGLDSYLSFSAPEDGEYVARVVDHLGAGGPTYVWRLVASAVAPTLALDVPRFGRDPQARQMIAVPRGNRCATALHVGRGAFGGDVDVAASDLPAGVTMSAARIPAGLDTALLVFEATPDAPLAGSLVDLAGECTLSPEQKVRGRLRQRIELVVAPPNETNLYDTTIDRLAVAVAEEAPFSIDLVLPRAPLVQNGAANLRVVAKRREGFDAPITVRMLWVPPGVGTQPTVTIPERQSEVLYPLNANGDAPPGVHQLAVLGEAESGRGVVLASSALTPLTIAPAFVSVKLELAAVEQGQKAQVVARVESLTPFQGRAKISLRGLPPKATAEDGEFSAGDPAVIFDVATAPDTPAGKHASLFVQVVIEQNGEPIVHYLGGGGVLRVDPPPPPQVAAAAPPPPPPPPPAAEPAPPAAAPPPRPLSRLEQLRLEAKRRQQQEAAGRKGGSGEGQDACEPGGTAAPDAKPGGGGPP
jgi:hypothetical protein